MKPPRTLLTIVIFYCFIARLVQNTDVKEVLIDPPNIRTGPIKKGKTDAILFNKPGYTAIGDPFKEAAQAMLRKENREVQIAVGNEKPFKPQNHVKHPVKSAYEHMKEFDHIQKDYRNEENPREVNIHPRNFLTNPPKVGKVGKNTSFSGVIPYMEDDFNRPKHLATDARLRGKELE